MADDSSHSGQKEPDSSEGGRLWRGRRALLFGDEGEHSLRKELEDAIDEYDEEEHGAVTGNGDLSPVERQMLKNLLHFGEHTVDDVAVPRADIIAIEESASFDEQIGRASCRERVCQSV